MTDATPATRAMTVLAFARSTSGFYFGELLAGLTHEVARAGGRVVVVQTLDPGDVADAVVRTPTFDLPVAWDQVDGAVAVSLAAGAPFLSALQAHGVPVVLASAAVDGFTGPTVLPDNHRGTVAAVRHLLEHGHTRIGFVGNLVQSDIRERHGAYREALHDAGLHADDTLLVETPDNTETGGLAAARVIAASADRPTAVMVATDRNALGLLDGLAAHGLRVPEDLAVIGFDNIEAGTFSRPALSSVSQRFDEVGALAGRMVVAAVRGAPLPTRTARPDAALVATRESCGCASGPLSGVRPLGADGDLSADGADGAATAAGTGAARCDSPVEMVRDELGDLLANATHAVPGGVGLDPGTADRVAGVTGRLLTGTEAPSAGEVLDLLATLRLLAPRPDVLHRVAGTLIEHVHRAPWTRGGAAPSTPARPARPGGALEAGQVVAALWQLQAETYLRRCQSQERLLTEQFALAAGLLDTSVDDPRDLRWLSGSHVRAGVLATWVGDPADGVLEVAGTFDPDGALPELTATRTSVRQFPPTSLVSLADPDLREACFVVPVRNREHDWGLLAVIGSVDTTSSRDIYLHWAQLLCAAFEGEELERAVRASEERYAHAARAANDGLWEWDVRTGRLYASARCRVLTGMPVEGTVRIEDWEAVTHPEDLPRLRQVFRDAMARPGTPVELEYRLRADEGDRWALARGLAVAEGGTVVRLVGSLSDVHARRLLEEQLRQGALHDELTGLPNRRLFLERLRWAVDQSVRRPDAGFAVVFLDLDGFKLVNDSLGHLMGDRLLRVVGERLREVVRSVDTAARFGGDEFAVLLTGLEPDAVLLVVERIHEAVAAPVRLGDHDVAVSASIGITTSADGYVDPEDVLRDADTAMYHAKAAERGTSAVFDPAMHARATSRLRARGELRRALEEQQFVVHYQPIVDIDDAVVDHLEALVRWQHPERGLLAPGEFIPEMEENGAVVALGAWLVEEVCGQVARWRQETGRTPSVSVNVSHREFWSDDLLANAQAALARHDLPPGVLVLEITESVVMSDPDAARGRMTALRKAGLRLHIDDFGTGQSSLHALRSFPVDALKIDGSFIRELCTVDQTSELVAIIVAMGRTLGLDVVAECVETPAQAERLQGMGCRTAQGWLYARALPGAEVTPLLGECLAPVAFADTTG